MAKHARGEMPLLPYYVYGWKDVNKGGIYGTFWRVPAGFPRGFGGDDWTEVMKAGGPGAVTSGTVFDNTLGPERVRGA